MGEQIQAPWSEEQVLSLNEYQAAGSGHPFTCQCRANLVAQQHGWVCPNGCPWDQKWCWDWMANWFWASDRFHGLPPNASPGWRRIFYAETSELALRRGRELYPQPDSESDSHSTKRSTPQVNNLYIGNSINENMFPANCKLVRQNLSQDEAKTRLGTGSYTSCITDRALLTAIQKKCGLNINPCESGTPNVSLGEGDSLLCLNVRGLTPGQSSYSEQDISNCEVNYSLWTVQQIGPASTGN